MSAMVAGCSSIQAPQIDVTGARVVDSTDEAIQVQLDLSLHNPNDDPLELVTFAYRMDVNGRQAYSGTWVAIANLAAGRTQDVSIPAVLLRDQVGWSGDVPSGATYAVFGDVVYLQPGPLAEALLDSGVREPRAGFSGTGELSGPSGG